MGSVYDADTCSLAFDGVSHSGTLQTAPLTLWKKAGMHWDNKLNFSRVIKFHSHIPTKIELIIWKLYRKSILKMNRLDF